MEPGELLGSDEVDDRHRRLHLRSRRDGLGRLRRMDVPVPIVVPYELRQRICFAEELVDEGDNVLRFQKLSTIAASAVL